MYYGAEKFIDWKEEPRIYLKGLINSQHSGQVYIHLPILYTLHIERKCFIV